LHQPPWIFGFDSQTRGTRENRTPPCVKVPGSSRVPVCGGQPSPHKSRLVVSHCTCPPLSSSPHAHSFVLGTAVINNNHHANNFVIRTTVINTPHPREQLCNRYCSNKHTPHNTLVVGSCTSHPGVLGSIPKREEPGKTGRHPELKYRVPHGSHIGVTEQPEYPRM
jgi:hypothetical protein